VNLLVLVVDDEPDVAPLFRQQFRRGVSTLNSSQSRNGILRVCRRE
jgi:hypothetical protein